MALADTIEKSEVADLTEFSNEKRVRKKLVQSNLIVSEFVCYEPGQSTVVHQHPKQDEIFYIIEGTGAITFEDHEIEVVEGSHVFVPAGTPHGIRTDDDSRLVVMFVKGPGTTGKSARP